MTAEFLEFSKLAGNDLSTPAPRMGLRRACSPGTAGACAPRAGSRRIAPASRAPVILGATHERALEVVPIEALMAHVAAP